MIIPRVRIDLYPFVSEGVWQTTATQLVSVDGLDIDEGIEVRKDTFNFNLNNNRFLGSLNYSNQLGLYTQSLRPFRVNDKLIVYGWHGNQPSDLNQAILMDGIVTEVNYTADEKNNVLSVRGANATEVLMSTMVPTSVLETDGQDVADIIITICNRLNQQNETKKIAAWKTTEKRRWSQSDNRFVVDNTDGVYGSVQAVKSDGTAFGSITYAENWKTAFEQIETVSSAEYTSDVNGGAYIFGIKPFADPITGSIFNQLFWNNKKLGLNGSLIEGENTQTSNIKLGTWEVINAIITNAGEDLYGAGILKLAINPTSMGKIGAKWKYIPLTAKFDRLYDAEKTRGLALGSAFGDDRFPNTYPWYFPFDEVDVSGRVLFSPGSATDDSSFNRVLRYKAGDIAAKEATQIVQQYGEPRYKAEFELDVGSNYYALGGLYELVVPSYGWGSTAANPSKKLRLVDARHNFGDDGWNTNLLFEEDEKTISDQVNS